MAFARTKRYSLLAVDWLALPRVGAVVLVLLFLALETWQLLSAWVAEDGFITFRVLDNAVQGYGLRWNIDERVQVYTHPLFMLLQLPLQALTHDPFYNCIALSFVLATATFALLWRRYWDQKLVAIALVAVPLLCSRALREYSISGLENPLTDALLVLFYLLYARPGPVAWFRLSLIAGLLLLTRLDAFWLIAPAGLYLLTTHWRSVRWGRAVAGMLPLVAWCVFSLVYYGFVFPNTKYAKLNTGIALGDNLRQSVWYYFDYFRNGMTDCCVMLLVMGCLGWRLWHTRRVGMWECAAFGVVLYVLYLFPIGADYMSGRFFVAPFLLSVLLLADHARAYPKRWALALFPVLALGALYGSHYTTLYLISSRGIADERAFYRHTNTLRRNFPGHEALIGSDWVQNGLLLRAQAAAQPSGTPPLVAVRGNAGMAPYYAGPRVHFIDPYGLTDPLTARLPLIDRKAWRIGHFFRLLPTGYAEYRATGATEGMQPDLVPYLRALDEITRAPVWDRHRWRTLLDFHLGRYQPFLDRYVADTIQRRTWPMARLNHERVIDKNTPDSYNIADARNFIVASNQRILFTAKAPVHAHTLRTAFDSTCSYLYRFYLGDEPRGELYVGQDTDGFRTDSAHLTLGSAPLPPAARQGFTRFELTAVALSGPYCAPLPPIVYYTSFH